MLVAQFQTYCRDLHDEAVDAFVAAASPRQATVVRRLLALGRALETKNPRPGALGSDFGRLGIDLIQRVKAAGAVEAAAVDALDVLVDFRNAVAHGNESEVAAIVDGGLIRPTLGSYRRHRRSIEVLVDTMDQVVSTDLTRALGIAAPW